MRKTYYNKSYENQDLDLVIYFIGTNLKENIDSEEIDKLLDACFSDFKYNKNEETIVKYVRTILQKYEEERLEIGIQKNETKIRIKYEKETLTLFEKYEPLENNNQIMIHTKFSAPLNYEFDFFSKNNQEVKMELDHYMRKRIMTEEIETISALEFVHRVSMENKDKKLCQIYKLFYDENPNFSDKDINTKFQTMIYILISFDIKDVYYTYNGYSSRGKLDVPVADGLKDDIERLKPLGEVKEIKNRIDDKHQRKIAIIGDFIKEYTKNDSNNLVKLLTILYDQEIYRNFIEQEKTELSLMGLSKYPIEDIEESIELVRKINQKIEEKEV